MAINLTSPTIVESAMLISDTLTINGATDSFSGLTRANNAPVSAALEIKSTKGALLLPRLNDAEVAALNPTPGMQIYNRQHGYVQLYDNTNSWIIPTGSGTVTSVDVQNSGTGISFSGGPITGSGTITATLSTTLQSLSDLVLEGILVKDSGGLITRALETADASQITISNADGVSGNPIIGMAATGITAGSFTQANLTVGTDGRIYAITNGGGSAGAPSDGTYILQTPSVFLPSAQSLSVLATGVLKSTTTTGVLSIAVPGTDYYSVDNPTRILDSGFAIGNFFIGSGAGNLTLTSAEFNTGVGVNALNAIDDGIQNTFGGHSAGLLLVGGNYNTGWGELCLSSLVSNDACSALGFNAAAALATGNGVTALGANAISATTSATNCFALGRDTVMANALTNAGVIGYGATVSASNSINIGNGCKIGFGVASPAYNLDIAAISNISAIKVADSSSTPATPASGSVFYSVSGVPYSLSSSGTPAQYYIDGNPLYIKVGTTSGNQNSFYIGQFVNANIGTITVPRAVVIGNNAGLNLTTGAADIVAIGYRAALQTTAQTKVIAIGPNALLVADTSSVVSIGQNSLSQPSTASNTVGIGTNVGPTQDCSNSVLIGDNAAATIRNTVNCVVLGNLAGPASGVGFANVYQRNVAVGAISSSSTYAGSSITDSTFVGYNTNSGSTNIITNATAIGANTQILVSNAINMGSNCYFGLNNNSPAYNLDIANISNACGTKMTLGTAVATSGTSGSFSYTYTAITAGVTDLALTLFTLPVNKTATVEVLISGVDELLADSTGGTALAVVRRDAGNIVLAGTDYTKIVTTTGDFGISVDTGAQTVILNATGLVAVNYYWVIEVKYIIL